MDPCWRSLRRAAVFGLLAVCLCVHAVGAAEETAPLVLRVVPGESKVVFEASSTLHGFEGASNRVRGEVRFVPGEPARGPAAWVEVEAGSLDTGIGARNRKMWGLLETERHRAIRFDLERIADARIDAGSGTIHARAIGTMTIRGQQRRFALDVTLEPTGGGRWKVTASAPLDMTDYGITPPRLLFVKVAPEVTLRIDLVLEPAAETDPS